MNIDVFMVAFPTSLSQLFFSYEIIGPSSANNFFFRYSTRGSCLSKEDDEAFFAVLLPFFVDWAIISLLVEIIASANGLIHYSEKLDE